VGTSSVRRRSQLLAVRPDLSVVELRGNVDTRLAKREAGEVDVLVLAAAGLERLGRRVGVRLSGPLFVPAPGQGIICLQARAGASLAAADHPHTHAALDEERAVVRALGASCHTPVGVLAIDGLVHGYAGRPDGSAWVLDAAPTGEELARRMLAAGAAEILAA
jgi:hydroxymethylbilane synthase